MQRSPSHSQAPVLGWLLPGWPAIGASATRTDRSARVERTLLSAAAAVDVDVDLLDLESRENEFSEIPFPSTQFFHHTQPVTAITDIPLAMRENEDGSAKTAVCPSPETDLDAAPKPLPALFDNLNNT